MAFVSMGALLTPGTLEKDSLHDQTLAGSSEPSSP